MPAECQAFRDAHLDAGLPGIQAAAPEGHASTCAACAVWVRRAARLARELEALPRAAAPAELEGLVVAALQAGQRQARAVQAVADLGRVSSPPELDEVVDAELEESLPTPLESSTTSTRLEAPGVLDRLVQEELAQPSRARARRYLGSLKRRRAPEQLRMRVGLALQDRGGPSGRSLGRPRAAGLQALVGLAAAALLIALGTLILRPALDASPSGPRIVIERVADPADLPSFAAALLDGASGGLFSVEEL